MTNRKTRRRRAAVLIFVAGFVAPRSILAADVGDVAVIEDDGTVLSKVGLMSFVNLDGTGKAFFKTHPDEFDLLTVFSGEAVGLVGSPLHAEPVRVPAEGIGQTPLYGTPSEYGSAGRLISVAFVGALVAYPADPAGAMPTIGHETGHAWLGKIRYDLGDGTGSHDDLLGKSTWHWSFYLDSGLSVMYGNPITDNGNGTFTLSGEAERRYGPLDQYLMGLRPPADVAPFLLGVPDPSEPDLRDQSPLADGTSKTVKGTVRQVAIEDAVRAEGPRIPPHGQAQCHFRNAFIMVVPAGGVAEGAEIAKLDKYRTSFQEYFAAATDGRGSLDTTLDGRLSPGACEIAADGGFDAGAEDAGFDSGGGVDVPAEDGGAVDSGAPNADVFDGGPVSDAQAAEDAGPVDRAGAEADAGGPSDAAATQPDRATIREDDRGGTKPAVSAGEGEAGGCGCATIRP